MFVMAVASPEASKGIPFAAEVKKTDAPKQAGIVSRKTFDCCGGFTPEFP